MYRAHHRYNAIAGVGAGVGAGVAVGGADCVGEAMNGNRWHEKELLTALYYK
jgi:hypothetical protein